MKARSRRIARGWAGSIAMLALAMAATAFAAADDPEADRTRMLQFFEARFPDVALRTTSWSDDLQSDARAQYEQIMEFRRS